MNEKHLIAIIAAILATRDKTQTIPAAVEEAKRLWKTVDTGEPPKLDMRGNVETA